MTRTALTLLISIFIGCEPFEKKEFGSAERHNQLGIIYGSNDGKFVTINNTQAYYEEYGQGTPLLLFHGGLGSVNDFQQVIPELSQYFRVIASDRPGHGRSEQADTLSYQLMASYTSKLIDLLKLDSVYVLGWSDGGVTGLLLAADRPDKVKKLIICGSSYSTDWATPEVSDLIPQITPELVETQWKEWLENYRKKSPQKEKWKKFIIDIKKMWLARDVIAEERLKQISCSTLVVLGDRDAVKLEHGLQLHRLIKGSQFCVLPGTSHFVFAEKPDLINRITIDFLRSK